jgi:exonuclease SbcD
MPAFRLLHTSDWHLGALFHDQARDQEEQRALDGVVALAQQEAVDAVVVAGDVFDSVNPSAAAQARYYHTLVRLVKDAGVGCVLLIGGNHDQGLRLDGPRAVLGTLRVHVRGQLLRESDPADVVVPIQGRRGDTVGWAALVPYLRDTDVASIPLGVSAQVLADRQAEALTARLAAVRQALVAQAQGLPMVAVTHTFAAGGQIGSTERPVYAEDVVGRLSRADISPLGNGCAYVALGHLHRSQRVSGQDHWRYCGSLLPMAMDETSSARQGPPCRYPRRWGPGSGAGGTPGGWATLCPASGRYTDHSRHHRWASRGRTYRARALVRRYPESCHCRSRLGAGVGDPDSCSRLACLGRAAPGGRCHCQRLDHRVGTRTC